MYTTRNYTWSSNRINGLAGDDRTNIDLGTFNAVTFAGDAWFNTSSGAGGGIAATTEFQAYSPSLPASFQREGMARIIAAGFEVHNDTETLTQSGSVTTYKSPQGSYAIDPVRRMDPFYNVSTPADIYTTGAFITMRRPPDNVQEATAMPTSQTWSARDGCLVMVDMDTERTTYAIPQHYPIALWGNDATADQQRSLFQGWGADIVNTPADNDVYGAASTINPTRICPIGMSGAFFTGLSPSTKLTVEYRIIVETLPVNNLSELALASPASAYDPKAMEIYNHMTVEALSGVPVKMNAKGDWWKMVCAEVVKALPKIASAFIPGGGLVVKAGMEAVKIARQAFNERKVNKDQQTKLKKVVSDLQALKLQQQKQKPKSKRKPKNGAVVATSNRFRR